MTADDKRRITNYMRSLKRANKSDGREPCHFPKWREGMTTRDYVRRWETARHLVPTC